MIPDHCASMRPRQSSLGIHGGSSCHRVRGAGFNEAEAIKPRNPDPGRSWCLRESCFNEAEAIKPRNLGDTGKEIIWSCPLQ